MNHGCRARGVFIAALAGVCVLSSTRAVSAQVSLPWLARSQVQAAPTGSHWADSDTFTATPHPDGLVTLYENSSVMGDSYIAVIVDNITGRAWSLVTEEFWGLIINEWWWSPLDGWVDGDGNLPTYPPPLI